jgi:3-dehydroquinate dehydratase-2
MSDILVLNGVNLNMLGQREPSLYGADSLPDIINKLQHLATDAGLSLKHKQSNTEHELVECIHRSLAENTQHIIANFAAFTHSSIALRDALLAVQIPFTEVHISNVYQREKFRQHSYFSDIASGVIIGCGTMGYELAMYYAIQSINKNQ